MISLRKALTAAAVLVCGALALMILNFFAHHPLQGLTVLFAAIAFTGSSWPYNYTEDALRSVRDPLAVLLRFPVVPLAIYGGWAAAGWAFVHGEPGRALAMMVTIYAADLVAGKAIRAQLEHGRRPGVIVVDAEVGQPTGERAAS